MITINQCIDDYINAHVGEISPNTLVWYRAHLDTLADFLGPSCNVHAISLTDFRRYHTHLIQDYKHPRTGKPLSVHTIRGKIKTVGVFFG